MKLFKIESSEIECIAANNREELADIVEIPEDEWSKMDLYAADETDEKGNPLSMGTYADNIAGLIQPQIISSTAY